MSRLAKQLRDAPTPGPRYTPGPSAACSLVYGPGDLEDHAAIHEYRQRPGETWRSTQTAWDALVGVTKALHNDKFRYHWNRRCACWTDEQRNA